MTDHKKKNSKNNKDMSLKDRMTISIKNRRKVSKNFLVVLTAGLFVLFVFLGNTNALGRANNAVYKSQKDNNSKITFTGDVSPTRYLKDITELYGPDVYYDNIKQIWDDSDLVVVNLEGAVTEDPDQYIELSKKMPRKKTQLDIAKRDVEALANAVGRDRLLLGCANNHVADFGVPGMKEQINTLNTMNINYSGLGENQDEAMEPYTLDLNGTKSSVTVITDRIPNRYSKGTNIPSVNKASADMADMKMQETFGENELNIVYIHWGDGYSLVPGEDIEKLGRHYIDLGADLVVGSHQHVLQPIEKYKDGLIIYGLGNCVFDQKIGRTTEGAIANYYHDDNSFVEIVPIQLNEGIPYIVETKNKQDKIFDRLTKRLNPSDYTIVDGKLRVDI